MNKDKKSFVLYLDYEQHFNLLNVEQRGELITAVFEYCRTGQMPKIDGIVAMAFSFIKATLDRDGDKWEQTRKARSDAGKKGGAGKHKQNQANQTVTANENASGNENGIVTKEKKERQIDSGSFQKITNLYFPETHELAIELKSLLGGFIQWRFANNKRLTDVTWEMHLKRLFSYSHCYGMAIEIVKRTLMRGNAEFYPLKDIEEDDYYEEDYLLDKHYPSTRS